MVVSQANTSRDNGQRKEHAVLIVELPAVLVDKKVHSIRGSQMHSEVGESKDRFLYSELASPRGGYSVAALGYLVSFHANSSYLLFSVDNFH